MSIFESEVNFPSQEEVIEEIKNLLPVTATRVCQQIWIECN